MRSNAMLELVIFIKGEKSLKVLQSLKEKNLIKRIFL